MISWAVVRAPVSTVSLYLCVQPIFGSILAVLLLGETFTAKGIQIIGSKFNVVRRNWRSYSNNWFDYCYLGK